MHDISSIFGQPTLALMRAVSDATSQLAARIIHLGNSFATPFTLIFAPAINTMQQLSLPDSWQDVRIRLLNTPQAFSVALLQTGVAGTAAPALYAIARLAQMLLSREGRVAQLPQQNAVLVFFAETLPYLSREADEQVQHWQSTASRENTTLTWQSDNHHEPEYDDPYMDFAPPAEINIPGAMRLTDFKEEKFQLSSKQSIYLLLVTYPARSSSGNAGNRTEIAPGVKAVVFETPDEQYMAWIDNQRPALTLSIQRGVIATPLPSFSTMPVNTPPPPREPDIVTQDMCPLRPDVSTLLTEPTIDPVASADVGVLEIIAEPEESGLTRVHDFLHAVDQPLQNVFVQIQRLFGVAASDIASTLPTPTPETFAQEEKDAMREAWELQEANKRTTVTTSAPATQPSYTLTLQDGKISFDRRNSIKLINYALPADQLPLNGSQYQPLAPGAPAGIFSIRLGDDPGSRLFRVSHQTLVMKEVLPMAITHPGEDPIPIVTAPNGAFRVPEKNVYFRDFLERHYAETTRLIGFSRPQDNGLIHQNNNRWAPVDGIAYPVREDKGKYYVDARPQKLPTTMTSEARQRYKSLHLPPLELVRSRDGQWDVKPTDGHRNDFLRELANQNRFGITPLQTGDTLNATTLLIAGHKVPFSRDVPTFRLVTWPAITDPTGIREPVPVLWQIQQRAFSNNNKDPLPGHYRVLSDTLDLSLIPSVTTREALGMILRLIDRALSAPYQTTNSGIRAAMGDPVEQEAFGKGLRTGIWDAPHNARGWFAFVADTLFDFVMANLEYSYLVGAARGTAKFGANALLEQNLTQSDFDELPQQLANFRAFTEQHIKLGKPVPPEVEKYQQIMDKMFIEPRLQSTSQPGFRNLFAQRAPSKRLWLNDAGIDHALPVRQVGDLYARRLPAGHEVQYFLSDGGKLRQMTSAERSLNARLEKVVSPGAPANLYRDINNDWLYVRLTDQQGIRTADIRVIKNDDWYEVPKFDASTGKPLLRVDQGFKLEGGKLVRLSVSELNARQPGAGQTFEKIYLSDEKDNQIVTAYLPISSIAQRKSGRNTYRYDSQRRDFIQTEKLIGPDSQRFRLLGGVPIKKLRVFPPQVLQWFVEQNIPERRGRAEAVRQLLNRPLPEELTREDVLMHFGVTEKSIENAARMAAVPDLNDNQKTQVEEKLPLTDENGEPTSALAVADFSFKDQELLTKLDISHAMLAKNYGYNKDVLINARVVVNGKRSSLNEENKTWLNSKVPKTNNVDHWDVAKLAVVYLQELTGRSISRPKLANYYDMTESQLKTAIGLVKSEEKLKEMLNIKLPLKGTHIDDLAEFSYQESAFLFKNKIYESMQARFYGYDLKTLQEAKQRFRTKKYTPYEKIYFGRIMPAIMRREKVPIIQHLIQENYYLPSWPNTPFSVLGEYFHKSPPSLQAALESTDLSLEGPKAAVLNDILQYETEIGGSIQNTPISTLRAAKIYHQNRAVLNNNGIFQRHFVHKFNLDPHQFGYELLLQGTPSLHPVQQQFLARFSLDATPQALATFYLRWCEEKEWPNITPAQLARAKDVPMADVFDALVLAGTDDLTRVQTDYLTPRLLESAGISRTEVAKFYLEKRYLPEWPKINLKQLAVRHKLNYGELYKEKTRLTARLTAQQIARVSELPLDDTLSVNKVAMLYRNNQHLPDWLDITLPQLAQYYGIDPVDLSIAINNLAVKTEYLPATNTAIKLVVLDEDGNITTEMDSPTPGVDTMRNINNHLPIIRRLENHNESGTKAWLGIQHNSELYDKRVWWCDFNDYLNTMPKSIADDIKRNLKEQMIGWIQNESSQGNRLDENFKIERSFIENTDENIVYVGDNVIYTGKNVMPKNTFIGFYAAIGLTPKQVLTATRKTGLDLASYHSWQVGNKKILSGYLSSNILAKMNTGQLGKQPSIGENNVVAVKFDNKLIGYVAVKDIHPDEPVYVKYGENFIGDDEIQVKIEPETEDEPVASGSDIGRETG